MKTNPDTRLHKHNEASASEFFLEEGGGAKKIIETSCNTIVGNVSYTIVIKQIEELTETS